MSLKLILKSASLQKLAILRSANLNVTLSMPSYIDIQPSYKELPVNYAIRSAIQKANLHDSQVDNSLIITTTNIAAFGNQILPKINNIKEAKYFIHRLSGHRYKIITAIIVTRKISDIIKKQIVKISISVVNLKYINKSEIASYIDSGIIVGYSGIGKINKLNPFISSIEGSISNILGMPLYELNLILTDFGYFNE